MTRPGPVRRLPLWPSLIFISGAPRLICVFLLPNAFGDAYAYIRDVGVMSERMRTGAFALTDLYGFWLPLYQLTSALLNIPFGHPFYVARMVSALFGVGVCLLVYEIAYRLTSDSKAAWLAFALIALSPLHIFNSASAMTDIPNAFFVLAAAFFVLRGRWAWAAAMGALAGLTRVDSWILILLVPALQLLKERRVSPSACLILLLPPLFWFYISWKATGDWLSCFRERKQYMDWLLTVNPSLASFSLHGIARDAGALLLSTDLTVLVACLTGAGLIVRRILQHRAELEAENLRAPLLVNLFFLSFLGFIVLAYLTHKQPIIFPRYGLILFALGLPVAAWVYLYIRRRDPAQARRLLIAATVLCLLNMSVQLLYTVGYVNRESAHERVAEVLRSQFSEDESGCIFNDDGTVLALSGLRTESFCSSADAPSDREGFLAYLKEKKVKYLVYVNNAYSTPVRLFPELRHGAGDETFRPVMHSSSSFLHAELWLYRIHAPRD